MCVCGGGGQGGPGMWECGNVNGGREGNVLHTSIHVKYLNEEVEFKIPSLPTRNHCRSVYSRGVRQILGDTRVV